METLTPLGLFHQLVLFKIMDVVIKIDINWIAVDSDGCVYGYYRRPILNTDMWGATSDDFHNPIAQSFKMKIKIPWNVSWKSCLWKI